MSVGVYRCPMEETLKEKERNEGMSNLLKEERTDGKTSRLDDSDIMFLCVSLRFLFLLHNLIIL